MWRGSCFCARTKDIFVRKRSELNPDIGIFSSDGYSVLNFETSICFFGGFIFSFLVKTSILTWADNIFINYNADSWNFYGVVVNLKTILLDLATLHHMPELFVCFFSQKHWSIFTVELFFFSQIITNIVNCNMWSKERKFSFVCLFQIKTRLVLKKSYFMWKWKCTHKMSKALTFYLKTHSVIAVCKFH